MIESWLAAIRDHPDPPPAEQFRVLVMLALRLDWPTGQGFASTQQLMADADASKRTVARATGWAREAGLLKVVRRGHRLGDGRTRATDWALIPQGVRSDTLSTGVTPPQGASGDTLRANLKVPAEQSQGVSGAPPSKPVLTSQPVGSSPSEKSMVASRRGRTGRSAADYTDTDKIAVVQRAVILRGWDLKIFR